MLATFTTSKCVSFKRWQSSRGQYNTIFARDDCWRSKTADTRGKHTTNHAQYTHATMIWFHFPCFLPIFLVPTIQVTSCQTFVFSISVYDFIAEPKMRYVIRQNASFFFWEERVCWQYWGFHGFNVTISILIFEHTMVRNVAPPYCYKRLWTG